MKGTKITMVRPICKYDKYKLRPDDTLYIACKELDFTFYAAEVDKVIKMWNGGAPIWEIAEIMRRKQEEIAILIMDLALQNKVTRRIGGVYGEVAS